MKTLSAKLVTYTCALALAPMFIAKPVLADPPSNSGPYVVRYDDAPLGFFQIIFDNGLVAVVGADLVQACSGGPLSSGDAWDALLIANPSFDNLSQGMSQGDDIEATVYPASFFAVPGQACSHILNPAEDPIATGTVDVTATLNDFPFNNPAHSSPRTSALHWSFHGVLQSPSSEPVMLSGGLHCMVVKGVPQVCDQRINLN